MPKPNLTPDQAHRLLTLYRAGGLSQSAFCQKHNVGPSLFSYWLPRSHLTALPATPRFQEVLLPPPPIAMGPCLLSLPSGAKLEFPASHLQHALSFLFGKEAAC